MSDLPFSRRHIHFVTGRLAERSLRRVVESVARETGFDFSIDVLPITVAALMSPDWIAKRIAIPTSATELMLPGYCDGDLAPIRSVTELPITIGPRDLKALPDEFGEPSRPLSDFGAYDIEILAEINHAPRLTLSEIIRQARQLQEDGADVIDVGCDPGTTWSGVQPCVQALQSEGHRVSIDSMNVDEISCAVEAGAELVLSVNSANRHLAATWGVEVVAIPDEPPSLRGLDDTLAFLTSEGVSFRIDPILDPIGCGFAASLGRYLSTRKQYPEHKMMMGIGNLTELTEADSASMNLLLLGICQEIGIGSVLTTQVINWARTSVRECDLARRMVHYAIQQQTIPKHLDASLAVLRDERLYTMSIEELSELAAEIKDRNYRLFAQDGRLHILCAGEHLSDPDPFLLFEKLLATSPKSVDASHAFYLGYELAKAVTALTLDKQYRQDEALDWGFLTRDESSRLPRRGTSG